MPPPITPTGQTTNLNERLRDGDPAALNKLIKRCSERFRHLASRMLDDFPKLRPWEQTDDVLQKALMRLCEALKSVAVKSPLHFHRLAALQIRRELHDLCKHYFGPQGMGAHHHSGPGGQAADDPSGPVGRASWEPETLDDWEAFHEAVEALPEAEREVCDLLWYEGLAQEAAADALSVDVRTVKRRWQGARRQLSQALGGRRPE